MSDHLTTLPRTMITPEAVCSTVNTSRIGFLGSLNRLRITGGLAARRDGLMSGGTISDVDGATTEENGMTRKRSSATTGAVGKMIARVVLARCSAITGVIGVT